MLIPFAYQILFASFAFILGACVGSFLNVCIYRMPRNLSVNKPKRSFCPSCNYQIPWSSNIPLVTWLAQRGRCRNCSAPIPVRYFIVELLTGLLFLATWSRVASTSAAAIDWLRFLPLATFVALLVVATFIDFDFFIIPNEITWGGAAAGILFSLAIPQLQGHTFGLPLEHLLGGAWSLAAAAIGFALLWLVSFLGKVAFGRKTETFDPPVPFAWNHDKEKETANLKIGEKEVPWEEFFTDEKSVMELECKRFVFEGKTHENVTVRTRYVTLYLGENGYDLNEQKFFSGVISRQSFKREAMGFGDVKFIACIGAFLGWKSVFFTVMAGSVIGALIAGISILLRRREFSAKIPFGPYLSLGALLWMFHGPELVDWYLGLITPSDPY